MKVSKKWLPIGILGTALSAGMLVAVPTASFASPMTGVTVVQTAHHIDITVDCAALVGAGGGINAGSAPHVLVTVTPKNCSGNKLSFPDSSTGVIKTATSTISNPNDTSVYLATPAKFTLDQTVGQETVVQLGSPTANVYIDSFVNTDESQAPSGELARSSVLAIPATSPKIFNSQDNHNPTDTANPSSIQTGSHYLGNNADCQIVSGPHTYSTYVLKITKAGNFTFRGVAASETKAGNWTDRNTGMYDPFLAVYTTFDPNHIDDNVVGCNDDHGISSSTASGYVLWNQLPAFTSTLRPGTYTLLLTIFGSKDAATWVTQAAGTPQTTTFELWGPHGAFAPETSSTPSPSCTATIGSVPFASDSARLTSTATKKLKNYAHAVKVSGCKAITLKGFTATKNNNAKSNQKAGIKLSQQRNEAVAQFLKAQFKKLGVTITIKQQALAAANPVASNKTEKGRAKNRRVEIKLSATK